MTVFNAQQSLATAVEPGDLFALFTTADTLVALGNSRVMTPNTGPGVAVREIAFTIQFSAAPTAVLKIFGSNTAPTAAGPDPNGFLLHTTTTRRTIPTS